MRDSEKPEEEKKPPVVVARVCLRKLIVVERVRAGALDGSGKSR